MRKISDTLKSYVSLTEPIDYGYFVYIVMFYEGVGNLFPWNALINASGYFATRFCGTPYENNFENFFSIAYTLSQTIGLALSLKYQKSFSLRTKIVWPLVFISILFIITTLFVSIDIEGNLLFWLTLIFTFATGILGAVSSSGLFGLGAMFPPVYTGALMTGQGLAGLTVSISEILTLLAGPASDDCGDDNNDGADECSFSVDFSALAYFIIATFVLVTCISAYLLICNLPFTMYYIHRGTTGEILSDNDITNPFIPCNAQDEVPSHDRNSNHSSNNPTHNPEHHGEHSYHADQRGYIYDENEHKLNVGDVMESRDLRVSLDLGVDRTEKDVTAVTMKEIMHVFMQIKVPALSVMYIFTVTIGLFPSLTVLLESMNKCKNSNRMSNDLYVPLFFLLFNLFDFCGRVSAGAFRPLFSAKNIWIPAVLRTVFIPLFLFCKISGSQLPILFHHDAYPILFMITMAISNGYIATLCMMHGASVTKPEDSYLAGTIMIFTLTLGLCFGACLSFIVIAISQGSV